MLINWHKEVFSYGHGEGILLGQVNGMPVRITPGQTEKSIIVFTTGQSKTGKWILVNAALQAIHSGESLLIFDERGRILRCLKHIFEGEGYSLKILNEPLPRVPANREYLKNLTGETIMNRRPAAGEKCAYFYIQQGELNGYKTLKTLFLNLGLPHQVRKDGASHGLNILVDKISGLGPIPFLNRYLSGEELPELKFTIATNGLEELRETYPQEWQNVLNACAAVLFTDIKDYETANYLANLTARSLPRKETDCLSPNWNLIEQEKIDVVINGFYTSVDAIDYRDHPVFKRFLERSDHS
ncbi:hypothetical protein Desru_3748 [Desulforamulus ruminis DSM 2154]|uniref:TraD/TraG TraM recognition site domain-containing protein n=1 Tax=Desulforamulus ruminis (strain ATCC 23193 / DSM 2154 / NCIMB 8452 / DL) TaxID=696281 RepID=F6DQ04_DESRL|nr:hypothetical protein Desru_3748 [Desulforamulus ruminis DSM 2154]